MRKSRRHSVRRAASSQERTADAKEQRQQGGFTVADLTRELETLVELDWLVDAEDDPKGWPTEQGRHIADRKHDLENVLASLDPQSVNDCAVIALILCSYFDWYSSPHASQDEDEQDRSLRLRIVRGCSGLARRLCQMSSLPPRLVEYYTSPWDRMDWPARAIQLHEEIKAANQPAAPS